MRIKRLESPVVLEAVKYTSKTLVGTIKVHNLAFEKHVLVRLTKDGWKTVENVQASFLRVITGTDGSRPGIDRFRFSISIDDSESPADSATAISMCVCYRVNGQEHWDNNKGTNYEFKLSARSIDRRKAYTAVANSGSTSPAFAFASVRGQHTSSDAIEMRKSSNSVFSYGFDTPRNAQNHARTSSPPSINRISRTDARRYMRYSEAKFSDNPGGQETRQATPEPANLPIFSATEWSSSSLNSIYSGTTPCDTFASYQTPSLTVHSAAWMPYPRSPLLHC
ncbi:hypothetical protein LPJ81_002534 [Coemansia sp. IMI 209127]|nr:hypothetical protein LPJ81_002534 [Coemansia sp. IMI 209127]